MTQNINICKKQTNTQQYEQKTTTPKKQTHKTNTNITQSPFGTLNIIMKYFVNINKNHRKSSFGRTCFKGILCDTFCLHPLDHPLYRVSQKE